jgi:glycosyltransferase 2 family protein
VRLGALRLMILATALGLMAVLVARLGPGEIAAHVVTAGPSALALLVVYAIGTTIGALPWRVLLPREARPRVGAAIASRFAASGANALLPLLGFGGEPVRLLWLAPQHRAAGVAAIIVDRLIYAVSSVLVLLTGALAVTRLAAFPPRYLIVAMTGWFALLVVISIGVWLVVRHRMAGRIHGWVRRLRRRAAPTASELGPMVDDQIERMLDAPARIWWSLLLHLIGRILLGLEVYVGFVVLGVDLPWDTAIVFMTVPVLLSLVGAIVPSQIGIQESTQAIVATVLGISPVIAVAVVLLQRIRQLVTLALAWILIAMIRDPRGPPPP